MQKVINVLAIISFVGTGSIVGAGAFVYFNRDSIIESVKERVTKAATAAITDALPDLLDGAMPESPDATGNVNPPTTGGDVLP